MDSTERHTISGGYEIARPPAPRARYLWEMATDAWYETEAGEPCTRVGEGKNCVIICSGDGRGVGGQEDEKGGGRGVDTSEAARDPRELLRVASIRIKTAPVVVERHRRDTRNPCWKIACCIVAMALAIRELVRGVRAARNAGRRFSSSMEAKEM